MKVSELRRILELHPGLDDPELRILVSRSEPTIGARPTVGVKYLSFGFDWDSGMLIIQPEKTLVEKKI